MNTEKRSTPGPKAGPRNFYITPSVTDKHGRTYVNIKIKLVDGKWFKLHLGYKVHVDQWDRELGRLKSTAENADQLNKELDTILEDVNTFDGQFTKDEVNDYISMRHRVRNKMITKKVPAMQGPEDQKHAKGSLWEI